MITDKKYKTSQAAAAALQVVEWANGSISCGQPEHEIVKHMLLDLIELFSSDYEYRDEVEHRVANDIFLHSHALLLAIDQMDLIRQERYSNSR